MFNRPHEWLFIIALLVAYWPAAVVQADERKAAEAKLPAEDEDWTFTLSGFVGTPGDRTHIRWSLSRDGVFKRQRGRGYEKLGEEEQGQLTPEEVHEFYVNAAKMVKKGKQDSRHAEGDGWVVTIKLASETSELSEKFSAADFSDIAKKHPEFAKIEKIIAKQTFKKPTPK